ncbi:hypothetical protein ACOMHN_026943 [Nucella lapillus]
MQLLTEKQQILERLAEHFNQVLKHPVAFSDKAFACLPHVEINQDLGKIPAEEEVRQAIKQLFCAKALGSDAIPAEMYKAGGPAMMQKLTKFFQSMWIGGKVPQQFKDASIVHNYKRKDNHQSCDNH